MGCRKKAGEINDRGQQAGMGRGPADSPDMDQAMRDPITVQVNANYRCPHVTRKTKLDFDNPSDLVADLILREPITYGDNAEAALYDTLCLNWNDARWNKGRVRIGGFYADDTALVPSPQMTKDQFIARRREVRGEPQVCGRNANFDAMVERVDEEEWYKTQPSRWFDFRPMDDNALLRNVPTDIVAPWLLACYQLLGRMEAVGAPEVREQAAQIKADLDQRVLSMRSAALREQAQAVYESNNCLAGVPFCSPEDMVAKAQMIMQKDPDNLRAPTRLNALSYILDNDPVRKARYRWIDGQIVNIHEMIPGYYERFDTPAWRKGVRRKKDLMSQGDDIVIVWDSPNPLFHIPDDAKPEWVRLCYEFVDSATTYQRYPGEELDYLDEDIQKNARSIKRDLERRFSYLKG